MMGDESRDDLLVLSKMAEQAERYEDMVQFMDKVVRMGGELSREERNLLSVAHKNVVGSRRSSSRVVLNILATEQEKRPVVVELDKKVKEELEKKCCDILSLLDDFLIVKDFNADEKPESDITESQVFYLKMKGDYYRYLVEVKSEGTERDEASANSREAYLQATKIASADNGLASTNPIRLGLALNFSVFYYEVENNCVEACKEAKTAFDNAISQLDGLSDNSYKDSTLIMQLLRDNLTLWTNEGDEPEN